MCVCACVCACVCVRVCALMWSPSYDTLTVKEAVYPVQPPLSRFVLAAVYSAGRTHTHTHTLIYMCTPTQEEGEELVQDSGRACAAGVSVLGRELPKSCHLYNYAQGWPEPYIYTPYMTAHLVISLPKVPYIHCMYVGSGQPQICDSVCFRSITDYH